MLGRCKETTVLVNAKTIALVAIATAVAILTRFQFRQDRIETAETRPWQKMMPLGNPE